MKKIVLNGATSNIIRVKLLDSSKSDGSGLTGLTNASSGLLISTICDNESTATVYTVAASHIQTIATLGTFAAPSAANCRFKEVDSTNHPGLYELQFADARFAVSGAQQMTISLSGAANLAQYDGEIELSAVNLQDGVHLGLSALPNAAAAAAGGLPTIGTGAGQIEPDGSGNVPANVQSYKSGQDPGTLIGAHSTGDTLTYDQAMRIILSALAGILSGAGTTSITIEAADGSATRIAATVDANGNRSVVTLTP